MRKKAIGRNESRLASRPCRRHVTHAYKFTILRKVIVIIHRLHAGYTTMTSCAPQNYIQYCLTKTFMIRR